MKINLDKIGFAASSICAVHCVIVPLVITLIPFASMGFLVNEAFENSFFIASLLCGIGTICFGNVFKRNKLIFFSLALGLFLLWLGNYAHERNWNPQSTFIMIFGGFFMCVGHWLNNKLCNSCHSCRLDKING